MELARLGLLALRECGFDYTLAEKAVAGTEEQNFLTGSFATVILEEENEGD